MCSTLDLEEDVWAAAGKVVHLNARFGAMDARIQMCTATRSPDSKRTCYRPARSSSGITWGGGIGSKSWRGPPADPFFPAVIRTQYMIG